LRVITKQPLQEIGELSLDGWSNFDVEMNPLTAAVALSYGKNTNLIPPTNFDG
jgi:hypothetical protein